LFPTGSLFERPNVLIADAYCLIPGYEKVASIYFFLFPVHILYSIDEVLGAAAYRKIKCLTNY
jgi:hypothetical protein